MMLNVHKSAFVTLLGLALLLALGWPSPALAQKLPDKPRDYVVDLAGVIDRDTFQRLNGYMKELEQKTGAQMVVLTINSTEGITIRDYGIRTAEKWKLGQEGKDNGVLIVVAVKDRKWAIETGYGVEAALPDAVCNQVGRAVFVPHFKAGDYSRGIYEGTLVLANLVAAEAGVTISGMPVRVLSERASGRSGIASCFVPLILLIVISSIFGRGYHTHRYRRQVGGSWLLWLMLGSILGGGRSWGGGFGGGGFGGGFGGGGSFGGGGGGSFGGGGASGGW